MHPAAEEPAEDVGAGDAGEVGSAGEGVGQVPVDGGPEAYVEVGAGAGLSCVGFGHEGGAAAELVRDLFYGLLEEEMAVGHFEDLCVADVELVLVFAKLALGGLDGDAGCGEVAAEGAVEIFGPGHLQEGVVFAVPSDFGKVTVAVAGRVEV